MKKIYIKPDFEFFSFSFEPVSTNPTPLTAPLITKSATGDYDSLIGAMPTDDPYVGTKYAGVKYDENNFSTPAP